MLNTMYGSIPTVRFWRVSVTGLGRAESRMWHQADTASEGLETLRLRVSSVMVFAWAGSAKWQTLFQHAFA